MRSILAILLLTSLWGLSGCTTSPSRDELGGTRAYVEEVQNSGILPVSLPEQVQVVLKQGRSLNGQLQGVSAEAIDLTFAGESQRIPLGDVSRVRRVGDLYISGVEGTRSPIRGEDSRNPWETLDNLSPEVLEWSASDRLLRLRLGETLETHRLRGLASLTADYEWVLDEMVWVSEDEMTIQLWKQPR